MLKGYGQPFFEDVAGQAVRDFVWRTPLSMNRRLVAVGDRVFVALSYRGSALSILDAASGKVLHEVELGGVDEIVIDAGLAICRVRPHIPMPADEMKGQNAWAVGRKLEQEGFENPTAELRARVLDHLRAQTDERLAAVDAESGKVLWQRVAPRVAVQSLAMADGKVVYHNYEELVALDAKNGEPVWTYPCPVTERLRFGSRNMLGNLLIANGKVLWTSTTAGGGVCLDLSDGKVLWKNERMGTTGGFGFPTAQRVIDGMIFRDMGGLRPEHESTDSRPWRQRSRPAWTLHRRPMIRHASFGGQRILIRPICPIRPSHPLGPRTAPKLDELPEPHASCPTSFRHYGRRNSAETSPKPRLPPARRMSSAKTLTSCIA